MNRKKIDYTGIPKKPRKKVIFTCCANKLKKCQICQFLRVDVMLNHASGRISLPTDLVQHLRFYQNETLK